VECVILMRVRQRGFMGFCGVAFLVSVFNNSNDLFGEPLILMVAGRGALLR